MFKVSVIIPVFNRTLELSRAIKSVLKQTFDQYELIVVDDHSTIDIAASLPKIPLNIPFRILKTIGKGVSAARNTGIRCAQAEFIAFLDSDDEWLPRKLEKQVQFLTNFTKLSLVHTNETWFRNSLLVKQTTKHRKSGGDIFIPCTKLCVIAPSSVMLRKSLLDRSGLFDENFLVCEDFDLWLRITAKEPVGFLEEELTIKHGGHSDQLSMQHHSMDLWRLRALAKHLSDKTLDAEKRCALKKSMLEKCRILLKGFEKHKNFIHLEEVQKYKNFVEN
jgi:glycosyltransferase involved in cell wall biosynthesis